ncbi:MAG: hypothetical protein KatS3mg131_1470 [Candidatus Tectimicrobiota bacterium]|nr:MAG: hypothetical protein KatS3mg131_1470 [Candidatus Tectomicrobia bacterium]
MELRIEAVSPPEIHCRVVVGGVLSSHKGVTVPRGALSLAAFTPQDQEHLRVGLALGADIVALSFVRSPADIAALRAFLAEHQAEVPVMAKIEKPEALDVFDALLASVDAVMVARGDLGVEVPLAEVPLIQKRLVHQAVQAAKPVVVATQMLRSMVDNPRPTRAEAADVANAVFDGADALMLSEETAVGAYPVAAVRVMADIVAAAERHWLAQRGTTFFATPETCSPSAALAHAACLLALEARAAAIVCCTRTGRTAQLVARHRPRTPIVAVSPAASTVRRLMLTWGVVPVQAEGFTSTDAMLQAALAAARQSGVVQPGERVVVVGGAPTAPPGHTDFLRLAVVR